MEGIREEIVEPNEGNQSSKARPQYLRRRKWRSSHTRRQGAQKIISSPPQKKQSFNSIGINPIFAFV